MIGDPPFPISIDALTAETLSDALGRPVESFSTERIGADRGMLGDIFLVRPSYVAGSETRPDKVVCKFAALREGALASAQRAGTHERELRCYNELLADGVVATPYFHAAWYDPETAHFLLVQEALESDPNVDQVAGIAPELAGLVATQAAQLHHSRWDDPQLQRLGWLPRLDDPRRVTNLTSLAKAGWGPLCELLGDDLSPTEQGLGHGFPRQLEAALQDLAQLPSTFIHSDLRADNLLFAADHQSVSLIDWQGAGIGPGSFDIAYLLSHSLTVADRREQGDRLIAGYLDDLEAAGTTQSRADFMTGFVLAMHYGLAIACAMPLIADTTKPRVRALALAMTRRSIAALDDYDLLW